MSIGSLRRDGRNLLRRAETSPYSVTLLYLLLLYSVLICYNVSAMFAGYKLDTAGGFDAISRVYRFYGLVYAATILLSLFAKIMNGSFIGYMTALAQDSASNFRTLLSCLAQIGKLLALSLLIEALTILWSIFFLIPGIIAVYRYRFAYQILFTHPDYSIFDALEASKQLTFGIKGRLFLLDLSFFYYYALTFGASVLINAPALFTLPVTGLQAELACYLAGTVIVIAANALFLPHLRASQTAAYFLVSSEEPEQL